MVNTDFPHNESYPVSIAFPVLQAFDPVVGSYIGKYTLSLSIVGSAVSFLDFVRFTYQP